MIGNQFQQLNNRFDGLNKRFDGLEIQVGLIAKTVLEHDDKFSKIDERFDKVDEQMELIARTILAHDQRFDKVIDFLLDHEDRLVRIEENMVTKKEFHAQTQTIDNLVKSVTDMKEDGLFGLRWQKRMQEQLDFHEEDIKHLKLVLNLV